MPACVHAWKQHGLQRVSFMYQRLVQLLRTSEEGPLRREPLWERGDLGPEALISEFQRECRIVRKGVDGDLCKVHLLAPDIITVLITGIAHESKGVDSGLRAGADHPGWEVDNNGGAAFGPRAVPV